VDESACTIDGFGPVPVDRTASVAEVSEHVRRAGSEGQALYPLGGRTQLDLGLPPNKPGRALDLTGLDEVIDYPARDMTITVRAGIRIARLQELLAGENQRLPVDIPQPEKATLGGAIAGNVSGPRRLGFGTLRDYVIGLSWVDDTGHEVKAGGRVVKNVAGYDLCKLHVGALGTLGILTQVTLKLRPLPEAQALVTLGCADGELEALLTALHAGRTRPCCLDVLNTPAADLVGRAARVGLPAAPWVVVVGYEDNESAVGWQVRQVIGEVSSRGVHGIEALAGEASLALWEALAEFPQTPPAGSPVSFKANLLPSAVASFCQAVSATEGVSLHAHAGSGIVRGHLAGDLTAEGVREMLAGWADRAAEARGNLVVPRCPAAWKGQLPVWGRPREDLGLMRRIKEKLDPRGLFNPGRFVGGL
jgi:glycolate oxidase FAD binding subunit